MKKFKNLIFILAFIVLGLQIYLMYTQKEAPKGDENSMVAVSSFALYDIAKHISSQNIEIVNILPLGVDPHSFEPTPKLMAKIEKSDIVFYSGAGLEPWIEGFSFKNRAVDVSKHVDLEELGEEEEGHGHSHGHNHAHEHHTQSCDHSDIDPHYWLDFKNMQKATLLIRDELIELQPEHKELYEKNAATYIKQLQKLDDAYTKGLAKCNSDVVVVNHNAIGYLSHNYGFRVESLSGLSPEAQPSPKDLTRIFQEIKDENVSTIFFENFVNSKAIRAVAKDANVKLEVFQTLGNITADEAKQNLSYEQIMYINLDKLTKALECN